VDWEQARNEVAEIYRSHGITVVEQGLWELFVEAHTVGLGAEVEEAISRYEKIGAEESPRLDFADHLFTHELPVGVCSLNCEEACTIALEQTGLRERVHTIVGRDSVDEHKPNPLPLLTVLERLGVSPEDSVFVGDSERDEETATRAGVKFAYVSSIPMNQT
jgi:phosphoglycolate phosphatase